MARKRRYTKAEVAKALRDARGTQVVAAELLGCTPATVLRYINRFPQLRQVIQAAVMRRVDQAEIGLDAAVLAGQPWAIRYTLDRLGKDRGYTNREMMNVGMPEAKVYLDLDVDKV
jgi:hypothetical protein